MVELKDMSIQECEERLRKNPESLIFSRLADCYRKSGDIQQAIEVCSLGLANHPDSITGRVILGRCYLEQEKYKEAASEFTKVIEHDRRNQVALKMLADIYAHQGIKEKAQDIYGVLSTIDPENPSIGNLSVSGIGSQVTNIYRILGFSEPQSAEMTSATGSESAPNNVGFFAGEKPAQTASPFQDTEEAFAQTIQLDPEELKQEALRQESAFAKTMEYEAEELNPATQQKESGLEEIGGDLSERGDASVTGDDISARMSIMFKEESPAPEITQESIDQPFKMDSAPIPESMAEAVSGSDISSRIDQLFGESAREETPAQASDKDYTQMFDSSPSVGEQPPFRETELTPKARLEEGGGTKAEKPADVSGEDIVTRMSEMFEESGIDVGQMGSVTEAEETLSNVPEDTGQIASVTGEMVSPETKAVPFSGKTEVTDVSGIVTRPETPETADILREGTISGDDIARRLETIFEEEDIVPSIPLSPPSGEEKPVFIDTNEAEPSVADTISFEEHAKAFDASQASEATVIQDISDDDIVPFIEKLSPAEQAGESVETDAGATGTAKDSFQKDIHESLDDAIPTEEPPDMSGDDVRSRLDEIFPDALISDETLSMVDEIPDGEKDDEKPNQGFYTMSGDNAIASASDETLLKQLDDVEIEIPVADKNLIEMSPAEPPETDNNRTETAVKKEPPHHEDDDYLSSPPEDGRLNAIPDHVLTPTLADIYFQQGQPQLAVQIYGRLLQKDPDNEKIAKRLEQIKTYIAENPQMTAPSPPEERRQTVVRKPKKKSLSSKVVRKKSSAIPKPLAGIRIKKKKRGIDKKALS